MRFVKRENFLEFLQRIAVLTLGVGRLPPHQVKNRALAPNASELSQEPCDLVVPVEKR